MFTQVVINFDTLFRQFAFSTQVTAEYQPPQPVPAGLAQRRNGVAAFVILGNQVTFGDVEAGGALSAVYRATDGTLPECAGSVRVSGSSISVQHRLSKVAVVNNPQYTEQGFVVFMTIRRL